MSSKISQGSWQCKWNEPDPASKLKGFERHEKFLTRIENTLYYGKIPRTERFSLPVSELAAELFSKARFPENGVRLRLRSGRRMLGLERLSVAEAGEISRAACISPCSLVLALIYVDRLRECYPKYLEKISPSRLFVISLMIASKFLHDDGEEDEVFNDEWATSSGIELSELNRIEREFLAAIGWRVYVNESQFLEWLEGIEEAVAFREGLSKGWFTYSELKLLLHSKELISLASAVFQVSAVCLTSYVACFFTLLGSSIIVFSIPSPANLVLHLCNNVSWPSTTSPVIPPEPLKDNQTFVDLCSLESAVRTSFERVVSIGGQTEPHMPQINESHILRSWPVIDVLSLLVAPRIFIPEVQVWSAMCNYVKECTRIFDSCMHIIRNSYEEVLWKRCKPEKNVDLGLCVRLFNSKWIIGKNITRSIQSLSKFWNSGMFCLTCNNTLCSYLIYEKKCMGNLVPLSHHPSSPIGASQY